MMDVRKIQKIREDFPILQTTQSGRPLIYLDNAATLQMPEPVLQAITAHYHTCNANVHRGVHRLSQTATDHLEAARAAVAGFLGADSREVIFTAGTTDSLNQLSRMLAPRIRPGMQILVSAMEHHSNLLPWQQLCLETGAKLAVIPLDANGELDMDRLQELLQTPTALVAVTWVSNVLGTVNPVQELAATAHAAGALLVLDAAQGMKQGRTDVKALGCDFLAFSGHKLGALTGIGVLYGRLELLSSLAPAAFGGGMVGTVSYDQSTAGAVPQRFEAGTPNYVGAISLGEAIAWLEAAGLEQLAQQEEALTVLLEESLSGIDGLHILGKPKKRTGAVSFYIDGVHSFDLGVMLDTLGIAVRTGHMCAQPLVEAYGITNVVRVSPAFYNTEAEIAQLTDALHRILPLLGRR